MMATACACRRVMAQGQPAPGAVPSRLRRPRQRTRAVCSASRYHQQSPADACWRRRAAAGALLAAVVCLPEAAHAAQQAGFAVGGVAGSGFAGGDVGGFSGADDLYVYTTRDLAVDLASPLVAYKVVSSIFFKQELPVWLDTIIYVSAIAAVGVVASGSTALDAYLQ